MSSWNTTCERCCGQAIRRRRFCRPCSRLIDAIIRRAAGGWVESEELAATLGNSRAEISTRRYRMKQRLSNPRVPVESSTKQV